MVGAFEQSDYKTVCVLLFVLPLLTASTAVAQKTDAISRGAVVPWKRDVATPERISANFEDIRFKNALGHQLRAWYFPCPKATHTILVCSGNTGNISLSLPYAKLLHDGGFHVMLFDYQGFGGSEGIASIMSLATDTEAAFQYLLNEKRLRPDDIGVFGISLGSILALMIAKEQNAAAVAVEDIFVPEQMLRKFGVSENDPNEIKAMAIRIAKQLLLGRVNPLDNAKACQCPVFLMHGLNDRLLPFSGSVQVAKVLAAESQVWLMNQAGHAPETLEVNDREYAAQLNQFFHTAMTGEQSLLKLKWNSRKAETYGSRNHPGTHPVFETSITLSKAQTQHSHPRPIQLVFVDAQARYQVVRTMLALGETQRWNLAFQPVHCSAVEFQYVTPTLHAAIAKKSNSPRSATDAKTVHDWDPELSEFSEHRAALVQWTIKFFRTPEIAHYFMANYGKNFSFPSEIKSRYLQTYPASEVKRLLQFLKTNPNRPPNISARYARLLARLYCWPLPSNTNRQVQFSNDAQRVTLAETMLTLLPDNKNDYFELGNASFQYRFQDTVIADALMRLARIRLRNGQRDAARQLLTLHVELLPPTSATHLTADRIAAISTVTDLDKVTSHLPRRNRRTPFPN